MVSVDRDPGDVLVAMRDKQDLPGKVLPIVEDVLAETCVDPRGVEIEITESLSIRDSDLTISRLSYFRSLGR